MNKNKLLLGTSIVLTGLSAGLLYSYSVSVNPAFVKLTDTQYIAAMQNINVSIQNPVFFLGFIGAAILLPITVYKFRHGRGSRQFQLLLAACVIYLVGTLGVTIAINVPLNNKLATFPLATSTPQQIAKQRTDYATPWNAWHTVRTVAAVVAFASAVGAGLTSDDVSSKKISK